MSDLWMVQLELDGPRLFELARRRSLPLRESDLGYLVHCLLGEVFGENAPKPFRIVREDRRMVTVVAYSERDHLTLASAAKLYADPSVHAAINWSSAASKRMPTDWREGMQLGFELRACPVVRMSNDGAHHRKGAEVDVFLAACWRAGAEVPVDREAVYRDWLAARFEGRGLRLLACELAGFRRVQLLRRNHDQPRRSSVRERPDALIKGRIVVSNPHAFVQVLHQGIGRHRAFGFGMLLLRPC